MTIYEHIIAAARPVIVSHTHPDGDAVGSTSALAFFLRDVLHKKVSVVLPDATPENLDFVHGGLKITVASSCRRSAEKAILNADLILCLDVAGPVRTAQLESLLRKSAAPKILIDHHLDPEAEFFDLCISTDKVSSTCELLYRTLLDFPEVAHDASRLPAACGTALMAGMTTDTNNFANSVFPGTLSMASELIAAGIDRDYVIDRLYNRDREEKIRAWSHLLSNRLVITPHGAAYIIIDARTKKAFHLRDGETDGLVNIPLRMKKVRLSALLTEDIGHYRVSLRSKKGLALNALAGERFNGGGHAQACGGKLYWPKDIPVKSGAAAYLEEHLEAYLTANPESK